MAITALAGLFAAAGGARDDRLVLVLLAGSLVVAALSLAYITEASGTWRAALQHRRAAIAIASVPVLMLAAGFVGTALGLHDVSLSYLQLAVGSVVLAVATISWPSVDAVRTAVVVTWASGLVGLGLLAISELAHPSRLVGTVDDGRGDAAAIVLILIGCVVVSVVVAAAQTVLIALVRLRDRGDERDGPAPAQAR